MTPPENDNGKPHWNESQVGTLLEDFFRKEMPADLRSDSPAIPRHSQTAQATAASSRPRRSSAVRGRPRSRSIVGVLMVGFSSLLMVMMAVLYWNDPARQHPDSNPGAPSEGASAAGESPDPGRPGDGVREALEHDGQGPVEKRPRIAPVGRGKPGETIDFPELDIEVFPLDRNFSDPEHSENRRLPEENPGSSEPAPMPEENRQLPENRPPEASDPDEAEDMPVLPELGSQPSEPFSV